MLTGVFGRIATDWDGFAAVPKEMLDAGDTVIVLGRYNGTYRATGRTLDAQLAHVWRVADGRIVGFQQYTDTLQADRVVEQRRDSAGPRGTPGAARALC